MIFLKDNIAIFGLYMLCCCFQQFLSLQPHMIWLPRLISLFVVSWNGMSPHITSIVGECIKTSTKLSQAHLIRQATPLQCIAVQARPWRESPPLVTWGYGVVLGFSCDKCGAHPARIYCMFCYVFCLPFGKSHHKMCVGMEPIRTAHADKRKGTFT